MRSLRLAGLSLKGMLTDTPIVRAAVIAIVLVPLLYGALYLWAFWDPYGKLDQMPVALVNLDKSVVVDGERISAGDDLVTTLADGHDVDWQVVSADEAAAGLKARRYYLSLTIPSDFSARLGTANSENPQRAELLVVAQESSNMLASQIMSRVFAEVRAGASESASKKYLDKMFVGFADAHDGLTEAALGAKDLHEGLATARDGARVLAAGASDADDGAHALAGGLDALSSGASDADTGAWKLAAGTRTLASGLVSARTGAASLHAGAAQLQSGLVSANDGAARLDEALSRLDAGANSLAKSAGDLSDGTLRLKAGVDGALSQFGDAKDGAEQVRDGSAAVAAALHAYVAAHPDVATDPTLARALGTADALGAGSSRLCDGLESAANDAPALAAGVDQVATGAKQLAAGAGQLADGASHAHAGSTQLASGTRALATGAGGLAAGTSQLAAGTLAAASGASKLASGSETLARGTSALSAGSIDAATGAGTLAAGLGRLDEGAHTLASGLPSAVDGADELHAGLASGAADAPGYSTTVRTANAEMMASPVELTTQRRGIVPTYGTGFTPYFVPLALWVGALLTFFLVKPLHARGLASGANPLVVALASYLPGAAIGILQAVILMAVVQFGLGLRPVDTVVTYAFAVLAALVFTAILQMLNGAFGAVGKLISIVVLMLQLTSAGGTFPTQMIPRFFQVINPFLPMSYVLAGLRQTVSGGDMSTVAQCSAALAAFGAAALAVTTLAAWRKQMFTMERLHPSLSL